MAEQLRLLTNSMRSKFNACHRAYKLAYVDLKRPLSTSEALSFGTAMHSLLEHYWKREGFDPIDTGDRFRDVTLRELFEGYVRRWLDEDLERFEPIGAEVYFEAPLMNPETSGISKTWKLAGKIDAIARERETGKVVIIEHKTTSSDIGPGSDYWKKIPIDGQVSGYYVGAQAVGLDAQDCVYDVIRKPSIRPSTSIPVLDDEGLKIVVDVVTGERCRNKNGSPRQSPGEGMKLLTRDELPDEYALRLRDDICARPDYYYQRLNVARSYDDLAEYLFDMWAVSREIADAERLGRFSRNPNACSMYGTCEYFDVCTGCASIDDVTLFRTAETPNEELANTQPKE